MNQHYDEGSVSLRTTIILLPPTIFGCQLCTITWQESAQYWVILPRAVLAVSSAEGVGRAGAGWGGAADKVCRRPTQAQAVPSTATSTSGARCLIHAAHLAPCRPRMASFSKVVLINVVQSPSSIQSCADHFQWWFTLKRRIWRRHLQVCFYHQDF